MRRVRKFWTQQEIDTVVKYYPIEYTKEVAERINRSTSSVNSLAYNLGLKKSAEHMKKALAIEAEKLKIAGAKHRFQKGRIAENKGQKMSKELYDKVRPTMFKKGHVPHNTKYDGYIINNKDNYKMIRVSDNNYQLLHRKIWEDHNGPIPDGSIITFIDGNKENIDITNLQMITKGDNARRNNYHRYPKELQSLIKLKNQLIKKINNNEK